MNDMTFYLGAPEPSWISRTTVPLCVSYGRLRELKHKLPLSPEGGKWILDSRGFYELKKHGRWTITPLEYVAAVARYTDKIGNVAWAASQDCMCEPEVIYGGRFGREVFAGTRQFLDPNSKLSFDQLVGEHQHRTVENFVIVEELWPQFSDAPSPFRPTLQGWLEDHYHQCWDRYEAAGISLEHYPVVALGSVCTREATPEIARIFHSLKSRNPQLPLHGFGVKQAGLRLPWTSADSQAWSYDARYGHKKHPACTARHRNCANCLLYALHWYENLQAKLTATPDPTVLELDLAVHDWQPANPRALKEHIPARGRLEMWDPPPGVVA